jgi:hypothetical protein
MMKDTVKWRVLFGGFFSYTFDAMDILLLAMCLQAIMADLQLRRPPPDCLRRLRWSAWR